MRSKKLKKRSVINSTVIIAIIGVVLALFLINSLVPRDHEQWSVSKDGILSYPQNRGKVDVRVLRAESGSNYTLETISFRSKDYTVKGLLRIPRSEKKVPAVVILPGASVTKEGTQGLARIFSEWGYASLGIDQRNLGGVNPRYDYELFREGKEPVEHKMVFDALRAVDVLKQDTRIDAKKIAILGESNGGRFAIIAAAIDPAISGVIGISTSGYDAESGIANLRDDTLIRFYRSIDPDTYLRFIPPRRFVMIHSVNDTIIPLYMAENTFKKAKDPKQFYKVETGGHGYSDGMKLPLEKELRMMFR